MKVTEMSWSSLVLVSLMLSSTAAVAWNNYNSSCTICRYTIIHRLFDACFLHFCHNATPADAAFGQALMKRASLPSSSSSSASDWMMAREARAPKKNVPTDWWRPLGLLFWANAPAVRSHSNYN